MRNNKNLWILMFGVLGAELGMWLGLIGNLEFLQKNVESSFNQSLILIIGIATGFIFGPWAGTLIDSLNKKFVLILSGVVRIFAVLFMLMAVNLNSVIWMLVSMFLIGIASSFYFPGVQSIIPLIAKEEKSLIEANAIQMNVMTFARIIGTALAGVLLLLISLKEIYTYSLIAYSILLISTFFLKFEEPKKVVSKSGKKKFAFKEVFPIIKSNPLVFKSLVLSIIPFSFISGFNLIVIEVSNIQSDPSIKGLLYTVEGLSMILTGFLVKSLVKKKDIINFIILSCVLMFISEFLLIFSSAIIIPFISFFLFGLSCGIFMPLTATLYQRQIESEFHGRFFSFKRIVETGIGQIALLTLGAGLDIFDLTELMIFVTVISLIIIIYTIAAPSLRDEKEKDVDEVSW
ncbi:MFS transporter [Bacillus cereus group sp. Bce033]|uniref:MFS transporter n=1 Tax=Bacillus TaxID=1386 RepID=UPI0005A361DE|nr:MULTISPECIES: MFS transporter [Bacillus]COF12668.1 permease [Streptococcus pneumoniae]AJG56849.1 major Facilitator Superfamily protein [Bacillus cereus D17]AYY25217.1 MFS transporter [Bacillus sp. FDAARGOS_527]KXY71799.1 hypothetical protein AT272_13750 [Bacillus cereus]MBL3848450.1 MFS transporter [Bacillus cereus]